ncbi:MAG TPA: helix-turn-helix domain-containing protein [Actinopolymorphaceae bacterium]|jgi:AraC-like DNA-binding protein|nr:helix-turn-helix domain-containing protein [Actinopolymorphaceae bacterium]
MADRLEGGSAVPPETGQRVLLLRIQTFIAERLGDPELAPTTIATAHHISPRYLHRLFETTGTSVASWIRARRLEHCRRDLLDPSLSGRPAYAIGARWGLTNAAHFNRAFRTEYGVPPGEYRLSRGCRDVESIASAPS